MRCHTSLYPVYSMGLPDRDDESWRARSAAHRAASGDQVLPHGTGRLPACLQTRSFAYPLKDWLDSLFRPLQWTHPMEFFEPSPVLQRPARHPKYGCFSLKHARGLQHYTRACDSIWCFDCSTAICHLPQRGIAQNRVASRIIAPHHRACWPTARNAFG